VVLVSEPMVAGLRGSSAILISKSAEAGIEVIPCVVRPKGWRPERLP